MHIRYSLTAADWAALADFQLKHSATMRRAVRATLWLAGAVVLIVAGAVWFLTRSVLFALVASAAGALAMIGLPRSVRDRMRKQMRAMFDETHPGGANTETRLEVRPEGLATESPRGRGMLAWSAFTTVDESSEHVFIGMGGATGIIIARARVEEGDLTAFVTAMRARLPAAVSLP